MTKNIDGVCFINMVDYAVRNLSKHVNVVNQLNVFPVPDGDTGTNMVTTIHKGLKAVGESIEDLPSVAQKFARCVVFEARGNSGVIVSQFLKGIAEQLSKVETADGAMFIEALQKGVGYAYLSVATPVEGTMLTVMKEATEAVKQEYHDEQGIDDIIDSFIKHAKTSLENTPELLEVLKKSGVVDSGGAGIVYLFEGMKKYLDGENIDEMESGVQAENVDYDSFHRDSIFEYGYCTEVLLQLLNGREEFSSKEFKKNLLELGDSLVVSEENDKVRIHIHTKTPESVFALCHRYGEFLSCKIENMSVQHTEQTKRILCSDTMDSGHFSIVAVAHDAKIQKLFIDMGADIAICCEEGISTKDYIEAFEMSNAKNIFVFPNSSDAILAAMQAKKNYHKAKVTVINSRGIAECYAALPAVDFEETDVEKAADDIAEIMNGLYVVSIAKRKKDICFGNQNIFNDEYYSFSGKELMVINKSLRKTAVQTIVEIIEKHNRDVITIFHKTSIHEERIEAIIEAAKELGVNAEFYTVPTESLPCEMTISFE